MKFSRSPYYISTSISFSDYSVTMSNVVVVTWFALLCISFCQTTNAINSKPFPKGFRFGVATASYQVEGAWNEDGKGENIWDRAVHSNPPRVTNNDTGDVACDSYHKYKEDVAMMKELGVQYYRFSLSWSRILPTGYPNKINKLGVQYYKNLIKELKANNIDPVVTLYHWDLPVPIQEAGGIMSEHFIDWFGDYAKICFELFGDDVKSWIPFNEPVSICQGGFGEYPFNAPFANSPGIGEYICAHNLVRAHAATWHIYDKQFRSKQKGTVALLVDIGWHEPNSTKREDQEAAELKRLFVFGLYFDPVYRGDYSDVVKKQIARRSELQGFKRSRLPSFTNEESIYLKGAWDILAINHYTTVMTKANPNPDKDAVGFNADAEAIEWQPDEWEKSGSRWLKVVPWGFRRILKWIKDRYDNPPIIITENGVSDVGQHHFDDDIRIRYIQSYLSEMKDAMELDGVNVTAYTHWSLMDNFEWLTGYTQKFGLYHVDFNSPNRTRTKKKSADYYKKVIATGCLVEKCS